MLLMIECSRTGHLISTGIETDPHTFHSLSDFQARTFCPYCNRYHSWSKKEACLEQASGTNKPIGPRHLSVHRSPLQAMN